MKKTFLFIFLCSQFIFAGEALLKIENFIDNGDGTVTFDIMISNDEDVQGLQLTLLSGQGVYDDTNECQCSFECNNTGDVCFGVVPDGCTECYYDNGLDFVANSYEQGYYSSGDSDSGYNGCSEPGECADPSFSNESNCEEAGLCNGNGNSSDDSFCFINGIIYSEFSDQAVCEAAGLDSNGDVCDGSGNDCTALGDWEAYSSSNCNESGSCANGSYTNECDCLQNGSTWTSDGFVWSPTSLWTSYDLPYLCDENSYDWNYANQDASGDDYRVLVDPSTCTAAVNCGALPDSPCCTTEFQFCRMPGINSTDPSSSTLYQDYIGLGTDVNDYDVSGHCSQRDSYCRDVGLSTCAGSDSDNDDVDDSWSGDCENGFPNDCCNNSVNPDWSWQSPYREYVTCTENGFSWTAYDNQATCDQYGGIWVGSDTGAQGNSQYDTGENFIDTDRNLDITAVDNLPTGFMASESNDEILMFSLSGGVISASADENSYSTVATITASVTGTSGDVVTLGARNICKDNYQLHCVSEMIISDGSGSRMDAGFIPTIWTIGGDANSADSAAANSDGVCSSYAGETVELDSSCSSICGDFYCDSATEDYVNCKMDCPDPVDGDGYCNLYEGENAANTTDCTAFGCGDYYCDSGPEDISNCSSDCLSYCGDGYCDVAGGENGINCSEECGNFIIGDEECTVSEGENYCISPADCTSSCGDGCYDSALIGGTENADCAADYQIVCGDGVYHYLDHTINDIQATSSTAESYENCLEDYTQTCGDGYYDHIGTNTGGSETDSCEDYASTLGDGVCDASENPGVEAACTGTCGDGFYHHSGLSVPGDEETSCPADYPLDWDIGSACGDGICDGQLTGSSGTPNGNGENEFTCGSDCFGTSACGDGYCDSDGIFGSAETSVNCASDCNPVCGDLVCARFDGGADTVASEDNVSCPADCSFSMCGDGECQTWWSEAVGTTTAGSCDEDCATTTDDVCTYGENDSSNAWYSYDDCFSCGDGTCQEGFGETATYNGSGFCYVDCWDNCGDGVCDGPENIVNCYNEGIFDDPAAGGDGSWALDPNSEGDCLSIIENSVPLAYTLSNNYPNPFNPVTTINYSVKNAGNVKIDIYNILGQHIYTLVDGYHIPGSLYQVAWNSSEESSIPISSGVYFYKMVSGSFSREGRMTIIK